MTEVVLDGCRTRPLAGYLTALGALRVVADQADPAATGCWRDGAFVLRSTLSSEDLVSFFCERYRPTPIVSPWNGGSGFAPKDQQAGIAAIESSTDDRLVHYRQTIAATRNLVASPSWTDAAVAKDAKRRHVRLTRGVVPDDAVPWIDASAVVTSSGQAFPPLLGTGGNVGRLEFSNNFMQRVALLFGIIPPPRRSASSEDWLIAALLNEGVPPLLEVAIGQFDPGGAGGVGSGPHGDAGSLVNPWTFVLLMEGALLFASGAARRMGRASVGTQAMPFMVGPSEVGYPNGASEENVKGELWAPIWTRWTTAPELARLIGEGRSSWRGGQARSGLDFVRATSTLGVDRGIDAFERFAFAERHGQNALSISLGRIEVRTRSGASQLETVERWLEGLRRLRQLPGPLRAGLRKVDELQFAAAAGGPSHLWVDLLVAVARLEAAVARSDRVRGELQGPLQDLDAAVWGTLLLAGEASDEMRVALALASCGDAHPHDAMASTSRLRHLLRPVMSDRGLSTWSPGRGGPSLLDRPLDAIARALVLRSNVGSPDLADGGIREPRVPGVRPGFDRGSWVSLDLIDLVATGALSSRRLGELLSATCLLGFDHPSQSTGSLRRRAPSDVVPSPAAGLLRPFFEPSAFPSPGPRRSEMTLRAESSWAQLLATGSSDAVALVLERAQVRLRVAGFRALVHSPQIMADGLDGRWMAVAALLPLASNDVRALVGRVATMPEDTNDTEDLQ